MKDPYVYPGTSTLINRYNIRDSHALEDIESMFYAKAMSQPLPHGNLDYTHLKAIHQHFFGEVYAWAGEERTVDISKSNSLFCLSGFIHKEINKLFDQLKKEQYLQGLEKPVFCERMGHYFNEINAVHPFREGNGRTLRTFSQILSRQAGYELHWENTAREVYLSASIDGFKGMSDSMVAVFQTISEPRLVPISHKNTLLLHPTMTEDCQDNMLSHSVREKLLDYANEQKKQQALVLAHYEARASDDPQKAIEARACVLAHFNELNKKAIELYHDAEIQSLIQSWQPTHTEESLSWDEVKTNLLNNTNNTAHQALDALLPPIKRAGLQVTQALSQHQSHQQGRGRKR